MLARECVRLLAGGNVVKRSHLPLQGNRQATLFLFSALVAVIVGVVYCNFLTVLAAWLDVHLGSGVSALLLFCLGGFLIALPVAFVLLQLRPARPVGYLLIVMVGELAWFTRWLVGNFPSSGGGWLVAEWAASLLVLPLVFWLCRRLGLWQRRRAGMSSPEGGGPGSDSAAADRLGGKVRRGLLGALLFLLIGPPVGSLVVTSGIMLKPEEMPINAAAFVMMGAIFSFLLGGAPAVVVGAFAGVIRPALRFSVNCLGVALLGGYLSLLLVGWAPAYGLGDLRTWLVFGAGVLGAGVCALIFRPRPQP